jgi:hypothetical protein
VRFTYDEVADAVFIYLAEEIGRGEAKRSSLLPFDLKRASMVVVLGEDDRALGLEILGASRVFTEPALNALREGRTPFEELGHDS